MNVTLLLYQPSYCLWVTEKYALIVMLRYKANLRKCHPNKHSPFSFRTAVW